MYLCRAELVILVGGGGTWHVCSCAGRWAHVSIAWEERCLLRGTGRGTALVLISWCSVCRAELEGFVSASSTVSRWWPDIGRGLSQVET